MYHQVQQMSKWWVETPAVNTIVDWIVNLIRSSNSFVIIIPSYHHGSPNTQKVIMLSLIITSQHNIHLYITLTHPWFCTVILTTSNTEIPVEEGQVVILPTHHHVDKCDVDDRLVLAGNFYLTPPNMNVSMDGFYAGGYEWDE